MKGFVVAATASGSGKTTLTLALMAALARRGLCVAPFKVGPDFIDPGHHRTVTGRASYNLDGWMLPEAYNRRLFAEKSAGCDIAAVEGVMGLFDGIDGRSDAGSTAQMAKWLDLPVLLVVDAQSMARSAAALVQGFQGFDPNLRFAGVVFNRIGSPGHLRYLQEAVDEANLMPVLGGVLRDETLCMPQRHLGLVTAQDHSLGPKAIDGLADRCEESIDMDALLHALPCCGIDRPAATDGSPAAAADPIRIAVAQDRAFCFYYPDNLEILAGCGAQLVPFSPIEDRRLPPGVCGLYLGGGYPELWAAALSANESMRRQIRAASGNRMPIYAECGGYIYLCRRLEDMEGNRHDMVGAFPFTVRMDRRLRSLGYREAVPAGGSILGPAGLGVRGHEFHYSHLVPAPAATEPPEAFMVTPRSGGPGKPAGHRIRNTVGSYLHLHFGSRPETAANFVDACRSYRKEPWATGGDNP